MVCDTYYRKITASELRQTFPKTDYVRVLYLSDVSLSSIKTRIFLHYRGSRGEQVSGVRNYLTGNGRNDYGMSLLTGTMYTAGSTLEQQMALLSLLNTKDAVGFDEDGDPGELFKANFQYALKLARDHNELSGYRQDAEKFRDAGNARAKVLQEQLSEAKAKLEQQIAHNTRLKNEAYDAHKKIKTLQNKLADKIDELEGSSVIRNAQVARIAEQENHMFALQKQLSETKAKVAELEAKLAVQACDIEADVGNKRARTEDSQVLASIRDIVENTFLNVQKENERLQKVCDQQQAMLMGTLVDSGKLQGSLAEKEKQNEWLLKEHREKQDAIDNLKELLHKARGARDNAEAKAKGLQEDNDKLKGALEKLRKTAKLSATTMGFGTRVWAEFLSLDPTDSDAVRALQARMQETVTTVHNNRYLTLADIPGFRPYNQMTLDAFMRGEDVSEDSEERIEIEE